jgi:uncharacterized RDD family membrane protein YckC
MKCPKCGYLGFETTERCRHCGYDFSLSIQLDEGAHALPLRSSGEIEAPLADFDLSGLNTDIVSEPTTGLDLDRIVSHTETAAAVATRPGEDVQQQYHAPEPVDVASLPLFTGARAVPDEASPLAPPPARPPLAVRRATPEVARRRTPRMIRRDAEMALELDAPASSEHMPIEDPSRVRQPAPAARRVGAAIVDVVILGSINLAVLYLTLAIAGLPVADAGIIPLVPMAAFLMLLNGGYLVGFTVVHGQTIGKMLTRVRVIADNDEDVDIGGAVLRALGVMFSLVLAGLPYLPVLLSDDRRALHDRLAGTRVIKDA